MNRDGNRGTNISPWRRLGAAGSAAGLTGVALLLVLAATSSGAVSPGVVLTKPYKAIIGSGNSNYRYGCGTALVLKPSTFVRSTGAALFAMKSTAPKCAFSQGDGGATYTNLAVYVPIGLSSGNHNVSVNWTVSVTGMETYTLGKCVATGGASYFSCYQEGLAQWGLSAYVLDTNGTSYYPMTTPPNSYFFNYSYNDTYCYSGTCHYYAYNYGSTFGSTSTFSASALNLVWVIPMSKVPAGHHFWVVAQFYGDAVAVGEVYNGHLSGESGSASVNFASLGNGGTLNSITVA